MTVSCKTSARVRFCGDLSLDQGERFGGGVFKSKNVKIHGAINRATMEKLKFPRTTKRT